MSRARTTCHATAAGLIIGLAPSAPPVAAQDASTDTAAIGQDERMSWWREARFGLFIHWGLYAIPAGAWGDRTDHGEWIMHSAQIPIERYEQFVDRFNPVKFDAAEWARLARSAGMQYIVVTTKHHDGFCLFNSTLTDYDVMATPFRRDVMRELSDACRQENLRVGWYHSIMDWHHPDYLPRRDWELRSAAEANFDRYIGYLHGQVRELMTNYGPIDVMWFDGEWEPTWTHDHGMALFELCRSLRPQTIINNRVDKGRAGMAGMTVNDTFKGDFGTPEQEVPATGHPSGIDWESCMTMNDHWGYNQADANWKSPTQLIRTLIDIASKGGNFLLNVGPMADGSFPQPCIDRLREIGRWMDVHGESIYGTHASSIGSLPWGRCTMKAQDQTTTLYLHVFDWPENGLLTVPGIRHDITSARLLGSTDTLELHREEAGLQIVLPRTAHDEHCPVVALAINGRP